MDEGNPRPRHEDGLRQRSGRYERHVLPMEERGVNEWAIPAMDCPFDRRACSEVVLAAGNMRERAVRDVSLRIGNAVAVLSPTQISTLAIALLRINDRRRRVPRDVLQLHMPTTNNP